MALRPGVGSLTGFLVGGGTDTVGACGGRGPDHALTFELAESTAVDLQLQASHAVLHLRRTCDDPETQLACNAGTGGVSARIAEVLPPGHYTLWIDSRDGNASTYTLGYSFLPVP